MGTRCCGVGRVVCGMNRVGEGWLLWSGCGDIGCVG